MPEIAMNENELYLEEVFTDQRVGTIRRMSPVTTEGTPDSKRPVLYFGSAQMMTPAGPLPLNFEISASSLRDAVQGFADGAERAMEETMRELQEYRRQQNSKIVLPGEAGLGSKLQFP
jgi:hypothetical protein